MVSLRDSCEWVHPRRGGSSSAFLNLLQCDELDVYQPEQAPLTKMADTESLWIREIVRINTHKNGWQCPQGLCQFAQDLKGSQTWPKPGLCHCRSLFIILCAIMINIICTRVNALLLTLKTFFWPRGFCCKPVPDFHGLCTDACLLSVICSTA